MAHYPVQLTEIPESDVAAPSTPCTPIATPTNGLLDPPRQQQFAQRLAVLIARIRAAHPEVVADEK